MTEKEKDREIDFEPGFDCIRFECKNGNETCRPGRGGSHGRHGVTIRWLLRGEKGAVQFVLYTHWGPEPVRFSSEKVMSPLPCDLGYHSLTPHYPDQSSMGPCQYLGGAECYYDGSGLNAEEPFRVLCNEGGEALWGYLEEYYKATFEDAEWPRARPYKWEERGASRSALTAAEAKPRAALSE
jgi:hypothetical protein